MHDYFDKISKIIPVAMILLMLILAISVTYSLKNQKGSSTSGINKAHTSSDNQELMGYDGAFLGVVKAINKEVNAITIMDVNSDADAVLYFNGGTDIRDKYNKVISISQIVLGEMVDTYYTQDNNKIVKLQISKEAWEYKGVENLNIFKADKTMKIADTKYQYNDRIVIAGEDNLINLMDINSKDELTLKGVGEKIWSIIVTKGHGYIRLSNYEDFIDGSMEVGYHIMLPIVRDMLIVAREGDYKITLEKDGLIGSKHINVIRNREIIVDMSEYRKEVKRVGSVDFLVQPYGALLYINGTEVNYEEPVEIDYGEHVIKVSLGGYSTYNGMLKMDESSKIVSIDLAEQVVSEDLIEIPDSDIKSPTDTESTEDTEDIPSAIPSKADTKEEDTKEENTKDENTKIEDSDSFGDTKDGTTKIDFNHTISVKQPEGAEVYLNGILKGTVPCDFTKEVGMHTITFRKNGYITKSYTILIEDDLQNDTLSFPEMSILK